MSTHANIYIKVKPKDYEIVTKKIGCKVDDITPYIYIYCHYDGYFKNTGVELIKNFKDYDSVLNFILKGSISGIYDGIATFYADSEGYDINKPKVSFSLNKTNYYYTYVFYNDKWYYFDGTNLFELEYVLKINNINI